MLRVVLSLIGLMCASQALATCDGFPRRQTSAELESRITAAAKAASVRLAPDFLTISVCGSGQSVWAMLDTKHELMPDGAEIWSQLWCDGGFRRGDWTCRPTDVRGIRVVISESRQPVQVTIPPRWTVKDARERIIRSFGLLDLLTIDRACEDTDTRQAVHLKALQEEWTRDDFGTFSLDGSLQSYSLYSSRYFLEFEKGTFKCWGEIQVVVTGNRGKPS